MGIENIMVPNACGADGYNVCHGLAFSPKAHQVLTYYQNTKKKYSAVEPRGGGARGGAGGLPGK